MSEEATLAAWLAPSEAEPDPAVYEALRAEIDKLSAAHAAAPDWSAIEAGATALLRAPRKDLRAASYLARARAEREGAAGARLGMRLLAALLALPADCIVPVRRRARAAAVEWYVAQAAEVIASRPAPGEWASLRAAFEALDAAVRVALADDAPSLAALRDALEAGGTPPPSPAPCAPTPVPAPASAPANAPMSPAACVVASTPPTAPPTAPMTPAERAARLAVLGRALVEQGRARFAADPSDASSFRLRRVGAALCYERVPAAGTRGHTEVDPPAPAARAALAAALRDAAFTDALALIEPLLDACPLWIEGHALCARILSELGAPYASARAVVEREARALVARLPGLTALRFADGSAIAPEDARRWAEPAAASAPPTLARSVEATPDLATRVAAVLREASVALTLGVARSDGGAPSAELLALAATLSRFAPLALLSASIVPQPSKGS